MNLEHQAKQLEEEIRQFAAAPSGSAEDFRLKYISKKGAVTLLFDAMREAPAEQKKLLGKPLNELKKLAEEIFKNPHNVKWSEIREPMVWVL